MNEPSLRDDQTGGIAPSASDSVRTRANLDVKKRAPLRVVGLDAVRGLCAIGVACYHTTYWSDGPHLHGMGLYGVYVFFVLSGASLFIAYGQKLWTTDALLGFLGNRLFRLLPLMAVVALLVGVRYGDWTKTWLTASMLFGFGNPGSMSAVTGAWSLGIEFVFYLVFPVLCALAQHRHWWIVMLLLLVSQRLYIEAVLGNGSLADHWENYTQPLSFASFFFAGCSIGRALLEGRLERMMGWSPVIWWATCLVALAVVGFYPAMNEREILLGSVAVGMTLLTYLIVFAATMLRGGEFFKRCAQFLGDISYGTYLLHPLVWIAVDGYSRRFLESVTARRATCVLLAVGLAWLSNRYFEMPIRDFGRRWLARR